MVHLQYNIACCILVLFILSLAKANFQYYMNFKLQHTAKYFSENKFRLGEYLEFSDNDKRDKGLSQWGQMYQNVLKPTVNIDTKQQASDTLDKYIEWDSQWAKDIKFGQVSAVSIDPCGNIGIFHRGSRVWGSTTFNIENKFDERKGPIHEDTIILLDKSGKKLLEWGAHKFYLPHGLTIDMHGNYWITDVALHQVHKYDAEDIEIMKGLSDLRKKQYNQGKSLKPSLILGEAFKPGNDDKRFCKPTAVAVENNGDFFVSDGYCNARILKFNAKGEKLLEWGRRSIYGQIPLQNTFNVPHALALASELNLLFVADRENGRITSFYATNGTFHKEYKNLSTIGPLVYSVAYAKERLYLINGPNSHYNVHVRGFVLDVNSGDILSQFDPGQDMDSPHDIAVSQNGSEIYVVELNKNITYKFSQKTNSHRGPAPLTDADVNNPLAISTTEKIILTLFVVTVIFIGLCASLAAVLTRSQERGCLLIMRKRMRWEAERRENYKLPNLLENRRGKSSKTTEKRPNPRDFNKLNTEPETSEDEYPDNSFTKII